MADAKQCDICGRLYQQISKTGLHSICFENDYYNKLTTLPNNGKSIDVCPTCGAAFASLYYARKELANEKEI